MPQCRVLFSLLSGHNIAHTHGPFLRGYGMLAMARFQGFLPTHLDDMSLEVSP